MDSSVINVSIENSPFLTHCFEFFLYYFFVDFHIFGLFTSLEFFIFSFLPSIFLFCLVSYFYLKCFHFLSSMLIWFEHKLFDWKSNIFIEIERFCNSVTIRRVKQKKSVGYIHRMVWTLSSNGWQFEKNQARAWWR